MTTVLIVEDTRRFLAQIQGFLRDGAHPGRT